VAADTMQFIGFAAPRLPVLSEFFLSGTAAAAGWY